MFSWNWRKEILTVPNLLSLFRLALIPLYVRSYQQAQTRYDYLLAAGILAFSCLTDLLDGMIARRFQMISHVGKILDPLADKLTQLTLFLCLSDRYRLLHPVLALFVVKELFQLFAVILSFRRGVALPGALPAGKFCTAVLFLSLITLILFPNLNRPSANALVLTDGFVLFFSFVSYVQAYCGRNKKVQDL